MIKDLALLSALEELDETRYKRYLDDLTAELFDNLIAENNTDETIRLQGGLRILNRIIKDITTATREKERLREREHRADPKHIF